MRYDIPDETGITRRERNENFGHDSPLQDIPAAGVDLWNWYFEISGRLRRVVESQAVPISWADLSGWREMTGTIIRQNEIEILYKMDESFCSEINIELKAFAERSEDKRKRESEKMKRRR